MSEKTWDLQKKYHNIDIKIEIKESVASIYKYGQ